MEKVKQELRAKQLQALTLKQFKVNVVTMAMHSFTVMAVDDKSAVSTVMEGKGGREAGKEGPVPFAFRVQDMSIIQPPVTLQQVMSEVVRGDMNGAPEQQETEPLIKPPGG